MSYRRYAPARPNCCYCGKPVDDGAFDGESDGWFSYGSQCMFDHPEGRYAVQQMIPEGAGITNYPAGTTIIRRFATLKRAQHVAEDYARDNARCVWAKGWEWTAVDLGEGYTHECEA